jgi:hypothetical protein
MSQPNANPAPRIEAVDLDRLWSESALADEYTQLANLPAQKVQKPGSVFSVTLLKIASIIKGSGRHVSPDQALAKIISICGSPSLPNREIERQWKRAYAKANARFRDTAVSANGHGNGHGPAHQDEEEPMAIDVKNPKTADFIAGLVDLGYSFRMNQLDDSIECNGDRLTDGLEAVIINRMRDIGLNSPSWVQRAFTHMAWDHQYHPIKEWMDGLIWDNCDHITHFCQNYMTESTGMAAVAIARWMIGAVAKVKERAQNYMLVIDGPQGSGKSTFARWLCPVPGFFIEGPINPDDKDSSIRLCKHLVWEVAELQSTTRKSDREALKHFISSQEVTVRKAYGRYDIIKPATASLIGTINEDGSGFLTDPTGNRRFVIICIQRFNWAYLKEANVEQMWAQAVSFYKSGKPWNLQPDEITMQREINARYEMESIVFTKFYEYFYVDPTSDEYVTVDEIISTMELGGLRNNQNNTQNELARIMKKAGAERIRPRVAGVAGRPTAYKGVTRWEAKKHEKPLL